MGLEPNQGIVLSDSNLWGNGVLSDQLFDFMVLKNKGTDMHPAPGYGIVKVVYLAAIGVGMIDWLWLIAWCALRMI